MCRKLLDMDKPCCPCSQGSWSPWVLLELLKTVLCTEMCYWGLGMGAPHKPLSLAPCARVCVLAAGRSRLNTVSALKTQFVSAFQKAAEPRQGQGDLSVSSAGSVCVSFLESRERGAGCSGLLSAQETGVTPALALPLCVCPYTCWHIMSPSNKLSLVLRLAFIAGGTPSDVSHCVCPTVSIVVLFDYNPDEA